MEKNITIVFWVWVFVWVLVLISNLITDWIWFLIGAVSFFLYVFLYWYLKRRQ
jgi:hypothetical protein